MIVALFVFAAIALCVLLILVALVSVASRREDRAWTLTEPASGAARSVARRLLGLHSRNAEWLQRAGPQGPAPRGQAADDPVGDTRRLVLPPPDGAHRPGDT